MAGNEHEGPAIGIDLGTTYSCVAVWKHGRIEIIPNDQGNRTTPSCVAFVDAERLIGDSAKNQAPMNPANTIFDAKRLIGRRFSDSKVQEDMKLWPFKVIEGYADTPKIVVSYKGREKKFMAEEISSMILVKMKETADTYLGRAVKNVVITVPGYFNDSQRQATKDAATIVGLNVLRMINEPTAAAIAYGLDNKSDINGSVNVLVFDLGGGTFDVSIMTIEEGGVFEVKAVSGDTHLGGEDFDKNMVNHCVAEFKRKWNKDLTGNQRALGRLRFACEKAKRTLSCTTTTSIELDALHDGIDFSLKFTRAKFEELNMKLFDNCIETLEKCLNETNMKKSWIDEIILVGGSTRIPMIQRKLQEFFDGMELCKGVNPDEAVAYGAAIMAANLSGNSYDKSVQDVILHDVIPLSLGIHVKGNLFDCVIPRNSTIPTKMEQIYGTTEDGQSTASFKVYQGERARSSDNYLLGNLGITGIPPAPKGLSECKVCLEVDVNSIVTITVVTLATGNTEKLTMTNKNGRLSKKEIDKMVKDAEIFKLKDEEFKKKAEAYNALDDCLYDMKKKMKEYKINKTMKNDNLKKLENAISATTKWLLDNQAAGVDELERKKTKLESMVQHFETEPRLKNDKKFGWFKSLIRFEE